MKREKYVISQTKKHEKSINYWSKMKELSQFVLGKVLFASVKEHLFLQKGHSDNPERQVQVEPP